jgi:hypothetical protein
VVLRALELIQDVRSGPTWETYWWTSPTHRVGTENPAEDLRRAKEALAALRTLEPDPSWVPQFPLPFPPETFVELLLPHLEQIRRYAEFRLQVAALREAAGQGAAREELEQRLKEAWQPVPEFDTWVGTFGSKELREQKKIVAELREEYQLSVPDPDALRYVEADRALQVLRTWQRGTPGPLVFTPLSATGEFYWPEATARDRFQKLVADGVVQPVADNQYQLADWENWAKVR